MREGRRNRLVRRTDVDRDGVLFRRYECIGACGAFLDGVVDADGLPRLVDQHKKDHRVALDWPTRVAEPHEDSLGHRHLDNPLVGQVSSLAARAEARIGRGDLAPGHEL